MKYKISNKNRINQIICNLITKTNKNIFFQQQWFKHKLNNCLFSTAQRTYPLL